jgi:hypothetical protein
LTPWRAMRRSALLCILPLPGDMIAVVSLMQLFCITTY